MDLEFFSGGQDKLVKIWSFEQNRVPQPVSSFFEL